MAVSGLILIGFVIAHLAGNLLIYAGPEAINGYAEKLRHLGPGLWVVRLGLLTAVIVHLWTSITLSVENRRARPVAYRRLHSRETTLAARTMMLSGLLVVAYLVYHLLHFTFCVTNPAISHAVDLLGRHDVYAMMVASFRQPPISLAYVLGMAALWMHLRHGIASVPQTLGLNDERTMRLWSRLGQLLAMALFLGYVSIPLSVMLGFIATPRSLPWP